MTKWLPIPGYESYLISDSGQVWSTFRNKMRKQRIGNHGYNVLELSGNGSLRTFLVHRLVVETFAGPILSGQEIRHLDGNKQNNQVSNLRAGTSSENKFDSVRHGTHFQASKKFCAQGHEFTDENTGGFVKPQGGRQRTCKRCKANQDARRYEMKKVKKNRRGTSH